MFKILTPFSSTSFCLQPLSLNLHRTCWLRRLAFVENKEGVIRFWPPNKLDLSFWAQNDSTNFIKFHQNRVQIATVAYRQTDIWIDATDLTAFTLFLFSVLCVYRLPSVAAVRANFGGATENAGQENAGLKNDRQKCRADKCMTGKWRTKLQGWKMQDWKLTDKNYRGWKMTDTV